MEGSETYNSKRDEIIISSNVGNKISNIIQAKIHWRICLNICSIRSFFSSNIFTSSVEQRFLVGRFSLYKVCLVKCWHRHFACARRLFVGILRMLVNIFFCVGGVGGSVLL